MRYRRVTYRSTTLRLASQSCPFGGAWEHETLRLLVQARWRPAADVAETAGSIEVTVDLAGVVEGRRQLPSCGEDSVYHAAGIPQGLFRLELPLPARIDPERVEARYERGLLHVTLPKR